MGRVLLAGLPADDLDAYLARADLHPTTRRTVTSVDKLRAALDRVRSQGWAIVDQELEEGLRAVAAPLRDRTGTVVAAVNISTHSTRMSLTQMRSDLLPPLLATAARIEADLELAHGGRPRSAAGA
jgi:IclR family pca regulon transcriptional regulator